MTRREWDESELPENHGAWLEQTYRRRGSTFLVRTNHRHLADTLRAKSVIERAA